VLAYEVCVQSSVLKKKKKKVHRTANNELNKERKKAFFQEKAISTEGQLF
jgi:hypothetical protein